MSRHYKTRHRHYWRRGRRPTLALELSGHSSRWPFWQRQISEKGQTLYVKVGVAPVLSDKELLNLIFNDTIGRWRELGDPDAHTFTVEHFKKKYWLAYRSRVFHFTRYGWKRREYHLTKEAGHSHRRIFTCRCHRTGYFQDAHQKRHQSPNIDFYPDRVAIDVGDD